MASTTMATALQLFFSHPRTGQIIRPSASFHRYRTANVNSRSFSLSDRAPQQTTKATATPPATTEQVRLSKILAHHATNLAVSRREAERWIRAGKVTLAGQVITSPHEMLDWSACQQGALRANGAPVQLTRKETTDENITNSPMKGDAKTRVWIAHKFSGELVTEDDPHDRPSLLRRLARGGVGRKIHLKPIGRLDMQTEGLILMTNNGSYAREMELPSTELHRTYRVRVHGFLSDDKLNRIRRGRVEAEGVRYGPMKVELDAQRRVSLRQRRAQGRSASSTNHWLTLTCSEGKNRQIRKVFENVGLTVTRLIRTSYGDYQLHSIPPGMAIEVPVKPISSQRHRGSLRPTRGTKRAGGTDEAKAPPVEWIRSAR